MRSAYFELPAAEAIGQDLIRHLRTMLPIVVDDADDPATQLQWIPVRLNTALESVFLLGEAGHHHDAAALVRVMADHLIEFAWLLADKNPPERINAWKNNDLRLWTKQYDEINDLGVISERPPAGVSTTRRVTYVSTQVAAAECDEFWGRLMEPLLKRGSINSFSGLYAVVFRGTSPYVHPTLRGSVGFFSTPTDERSGRLFLIDQPHGFLPGTYSHALVITLLAAWILTARFRHEDVPLVLTLIERTTRLIERLNQGRWVPDP